VGPRAGLDGCGKSRPPPGFDPRTTDVARLLLIWIDRLSHGAESTFSSSVSTVIESISCRSFPGTVQLLRSPVLFWSSAPT